jgi:hypothetical protein
MPKRVCTGKNFNRRWTQIYADKKRAAPNGRPTVAVWRLPDPAPGLAIREGVPEANGVFSPLIRGRLWASGTTDREDAIPPGAGPRSRRTATEPCLIHVP